MKKRMVWLDLLRIIGMICVIMMHIVGNTINTFHLAGNAQVIYSTVALLCYFSIPLFIMLSGMYFLNKDIDVSLMLKKYCKRILLIILIFGGAFSFLELYFDTRVISINYIPKTLKNIITGNLWAHMWYLYTILGLYLITPFLRIITKNIKEKDYKYFLILLFIFSILIPDIQSIFNVNIAFTIPIASAFVFYYIYGAYIINHKSTLWETLISIFLGIVSMVLIIISSITKTPYIPISYGSITVFLVANMVLVLFKNKEIKMPKKLQAFIASLGSCSLGIYVIHQFFINVVYKLLKFKFILTSPYLGFILYVFLILGISYITIYLIKKIPFVSKYIF